MKVTVTTLTDAVVMLDVSPDMELINFKALCEAETGFPAKEIVLTHEGVPLLDDKKDLKNFGIKEGDVLLIQQFVPQQMFNEGAPRLDIDFSSIQVPGRAGQQNVQGQQNMAQPNRENDPDYIADMLLRNPSQLSALRQSNPRLAEALLSGDREQFKEVLQKQWEVKAERERKRIQMMNADPFDLEAQRLIAEEIRQDNIDSNMEAAIEHHPESFGQVIMLYINCKVNGHPVKAFIDSGAQTTIMSQACAERCGIMRLVDRRWAGIAKGVGTQKIIGRVHLGQIQIEDAFLTSSFSILEEQPMDMLLGLDMLRRHQCCIDLKRNALVIGTTGTETPFLPEGELPKERLVHSLVDGQLTSEEYEKEQLKYLESQDHSQGPSAAGPSKQQSGVNMETASPTSNEEIQIQNMMKLGFSRSQVTEELRRFNGDPNQALAALLAKSIQLP